MRNENNQQKNTGLTFKEAWKEQILEPLIKNYEEKKQLKSNCIKDNTKPEDKKQNS